MTPDQPWYLRFITGYLLLLAASWSAGIAIVAAMDISRGRSIPDIAARVFGSMFVFGSWGVFLGIPLLLLLLIATAIGRTIRSNLSA